MKESSSSAESEYGGGSSIAWNPYNFDFSNVKESASGSGYQFDTYNPKYNNNPEGHGYQDNYKYSSSGSGEYDGSSEHYNRQRGTIGSDMYASGSSHRPKKIPSGASHQKRQPKSQKVKVKQQRTSKRFSQHSRDLQRDLTPPPAEY